MQQAVFGNPAAGTPAASRRRLATFPRIAGEPGFVEIVGVGSLGLDRLASLLLH